MFSVTVVDSSGVEIVTSSAINAPTWVVDTLPNAQIGVVEGEQPYILSRVRAALRLEDGRILVADGGTMQLRYFSPEGEFLGAVGRKGSGPGEFQAISAVITLSDSIVLIHDGRLRRLTTVSHAMKVIHDRRSPAGSLAAVLPNNELMYTADKLMAAVAGYGRDTLIITVSQLDGQRPAIDSSTVGVDANTPLTADTILMLPSTERINEVSQATRGRSVMSHIHPFGYSATAAVWNGDIVTARTETPELRVFDSKGRLKRIIRRSDATPTSLEGAPLAEYSRAVEAAGYSADAAKEIMDRFPGPRFVPAMDAALQDDLGLLWISDFVPFVGADALRSPQWTVLERTGRIVARASMPARFTPKHIGERFVVGVYQDADGVEYVRSYALQRVL